MSTLKQTAKSFLDSGVNVLPADRAMKKPIGSWKRYRSEKNSDLSQFDRADAICAVCGSISGNLEVIDFDCKGAFFRRFYESAKTEFGTDFVQKLVLERSPSGGCHLAYRYQVRDGEEISANDKLAYMEVESETGSDGEAEFQGKTYKVQPNGKFYPIAIETRSEGGIVLIAPSPGYAVIQNDWDALPTLTADERDRLIAIARSFDQKPKPKRGRPKSVQTPPPPSVPIDGATPFDWIREQPELLRSLLESHGWTRCDSKDNAEFEQWTRPGKKSGSISGGFSKQYGYFKCWSTNASPLEGDRTYSPFQLFAALETGGDEKEAAKRIRADFMQEPGTSRTSYPLRVSFNLAKISRVSDHESSVVKTDAKPVKSSFSIEQPKFPPRLLDTKRLGLIGRIMEFTNENAYKEQPELAFAGAISCLSFMTARRIKTPGGIRPNLYAAAVSDAGSGKEAARRASIEIVRIYNPHYQFPETFDSKQAFLEFMQIFPATYYLSDEFGSLLKQISSEHCNAYLKQMVDEWLKLFSSSDKNAYLPKLNVTAVRERTKKEGPGKFQTINQPHLTLYGTTNKDTFFKAINSSLIANGFLPRCFIFEGRDNVKSKPRSYNDTVDWTVPDDIAETALAWKSFNRPRNDDGEKTLFDEDNPPNPVVVRFTDEADELIARYRVEELESISVKEEDEKEIFARIPEKILKAALLFAASKYGPDETSLIIDRECAELAVELGRFQIAQFRYWKQNYISNTEIERDLKKIQCWFVSRWAKSPKVTHREYSTQFARLDLRVRNQHIETLKDCGFLTVKLERGKVYSPYVEETNDEPEQEAKE